MSLRLCKLPAGNQNDNNMAGGVFELVVTLVLFAASIISLLVSSKPRKRKFNHWIKRIALELGRIRRKGDHIRAAVILRIIDRRVANLIAEYLKRLLKVSGGWSSNESIGEGLGMLVIFGPFIWLALFGTNDGLFVLFLASMWTIVLILVGYLYFDIEGGQAEEGRKLFAADVSAYYTRLTGIKGIAQVIFAPLGFPFGVRVRMMHLLDGTDEIVFGARMDYRTFVLATTLSSPMIILLVHKLFINVLDLPALAFYPLVGVLGVCFFMFVGLLVVLAFATATIGAKNSWTPSASRRVVRGALYLALTTTVSLIFYYSARFEAEPQFSTRSAFLLYINIVCDVYVIYLFNRLVQAIVATRRKSNEYSNVILIEYLLLIVRSLVASFVSIYVGFLLTDKPLSLEQAFQLLVGVHPFTGESYFGPVFWLVHSALLPAALILLVPVLLIGYRLMQVIVNRILVGIVRHGEPAIVIPTSLVFVATGIKLVWTLLIN